MNISGDYLCSEYTLDDEGYDYDITKLKIPYTEGALLGGNIIKIILRKWSGRSDYHEYYILELFGQYYKLFGFVFSDIRMLKSIEIPFILKQFSVDLLELDVLSTKRQARLFRKTIMHHRTRYPLAIDKPSQFLDSLFEKDKRNIQTYILPFPFE